MKYLDGNKIINQHEYEISESKSHLVYVNDPVNFKLHSNYITIVNGESFEILIPLEDNNVDAQLSVNKINGHEEAIVQISNPSIILVPDTISIIQDSISNEIIISLLNGLNYHL